MLRAAPDSFRKQVTLIAIAAVSMAALAIILVRDVLATAEQALVEDAAQQCTTAAKELGTQLAEMAQLREETLFVLPLEAQDLSLRGLSAAVLRSYDGLAGGFLAQESGTVLGATTSGTTESPSLTQAELDLIRSLAESPGGTTKTVPDGRDVLVGAAAASEADGAVAWSLKRIAGVRDPIYIRRQWGLLALVLLATMAVGGVVAMSVRLRRGVDAVNAGLKRLESDFSYRFPEGTGELGAIAAAINHMADKRAELEATLRRQDRLAALGKVVGGVAHEIRNPLNSMRLALELANRRLQKGNATGEEIAGAIEEVDRLDRIVTRLLAFGKPEFDDRRVQDLRPVIERVVNMLEQPAAQQQVRFELTLPEEPSEADLDELQIEQVLMNLLLNAVDASPPGSPVEVIARKEGDALSIEVRDQGPGIPAGIREHIFDPYFTTKPTGNGLGLAVSREFVQRHGGTLQLGSSNGNGASFIVRLPATRIAG